MNRLRLLPVLVFGLVCLLTVKLLSFAFDRPNSRPIAMGSPGDHFARTIKIAREGVQEQEIVTGSVDKAKPADKPGEAPKPGDKAGEKPGDKAADAKAPDGKQPKPKLNSEPEGVRLPPPNGAPGQPQQSQAERALLEKLKDRRGEIESRDRELEMRETLLRATERKLDEKIGQLRTLEGSGEGGSNKPADVKNRYKPLVTMYESMKPKEAARVFDRLDIKVLIELVEHMNPRKMSEILAAMEPAAAEKLTVALARKAAQGEIAQLDDKGQQKQDTELQRLPAAPRR